MISSCIILFTVGSPNPFEKDAVKNYLTQFLSDPMVVSPALARFFALKGVKKRLDMITNRYKSCIKEGRAPLLEHLGILKQKLQDKLDEKCLYSTSDEFSNRSFSVVEACLYSRPYADKILCDAFCSYDEILLIPLFPQSTRSTHQSIYNLMVKNAHAHNYKGRFAMLKGFSGFRPYCDLIKSSVAKWHDCSSHKTDTLIVSFHALPKTILGLVEKDYLKQCRKLFLMLEGQAAALGVKAKLTFHSQMGPLPWTKPYLKDVIKKEAQENHSIAVICPGFILDCIETLHEVDVTERQNFAKLTTAHFDFIKAPSLDDTATLMLYIVIEFLKSTESRDHLLQLDDCR